MSHTIRICANYHNAHAKPTQILLVMKTSIDGQQGIKTLVGPP